MLLPIQIGHKTGKILRFWNLCQPMSNKFGKNIQLYAILTKPKELLKTRPLLKLPKLLRTSKLTTENLEKI